MIYTNNHERDTMAKEAIKAIQARVLCIPKIIEGESILVNPEGKSSLIVDQVKKWVAGPDDIDAIVNQLTMTEQPQKMTAFDKLREAVNLPKKEADDKILQ